MNTVPKSGLIIANTDDNSVKEVIKSSHSPIQTFGLESDAYWRIREIETTQKGTVFTLWREQHDYGKFQVPLYGKHNVQNAVAAMAAGFNAGINVDLLRAGIASFKGVKRRQELLGIWNDIIVIDDFAHHPTAVENTLTAISQVYPNHRMWALFEPASSTNSRAIFEEDYISALSNASNIIIGQVPRPDRARMDTPFIPKRLVDKLNTIGKHAWCFESPNQISLHLSENIRSGDVVVFLSNGNFSGIQKAFIKKLETSYAQN